MPGGLWELWDRVVASNPGLSRLRMAASGAVAMGSALAVEYGFATATNASAQGTLIAMLLGAIVAMMGSMALTGTGAWAKARTAVFFPVAIGSGMLAGVAVGGRTDLMLIVFVVVMFVAVFVRRFGVAFFFYGFMAWLGYFFAAFLHATVAMMPTLIAAVVVGSAWVLLLSITVLRGNPARTLRRTVRAFDARARAVARASAELLKRAGTEPSRVARMQGRLRARQTQLAEVALMAEAWSAEPASLPAGWSAPALRRRLLEAHQAVDGLAAAADALATADVELRAAAIAVLDRLARQDDAAAGLAAHALADAAERVPTGPDGACADDSLAARHLAVASLDFLALAGRAEAPT